MFYGFPLFLIDRPKNWQAAPNNFTVPILMVFISITEISHFMPSMI